TDLAARADVALTKFQQEASNRKTAASEASTDEEPAEQGEEEVQQATHEQLQNGFGALYTQQATTFRVYAPAAKGVSVVVYGNPTGDAGRNVYPLRQESNGVWDASVRGDLQGKNYAYLLNPNDPKGGREVLDPYATNAVASSTRGRITPLP